MWLSWQKLISVDLVGLWDEGGRSAAGNRSRRSGMEESQSHRLILIMRGGKKAKNLAGISGRVGAVRR